MGLTQNVGDRIHLINQKLSGVLACRYWIAELERAPLIVPLVGPETKAIQTAGAEQFSAERIWTLFCVVGTWTHGLPSKSASAAAEDIIDQITESYMTRPRLEYNGAPLNWVERAELGSDDGIFQYADDYAALRFPLTVTTRRSVTYNSSD